MKKIMHIVEAFGGGVFTYLVDLVNSTDKDYEVIIAYAERPQTPANFKQYFSERVKFIEVKNFARSINPIKDLKAFLEIKRIIKNEKPEVIHLHSSKAGFIGRFAANGRKMKMLYNPHGFSFLMKDSSKIKRFMYWWIEKIATIRKCTVIGCSNGEYEEALKLTKDSICINNGINIKKIKEETKNLQEKEINLQNLKICTIGRIGYQKNPKLFNEIAESLQDIQFTWIGDGELKNELKSNNIGITGWLERKEVVKILNDNDIFILTSLWEGLPISLLEAMYMKKICIVSDCIGNRDVINTNINGFVAKNKDEFVDYIKKIQENQYDLNSIRKQQISDIDNEYNTNIMAVKYKEEYEG